MGYFQTGIGELRIAKENLDAAWAAILKLNREAPDSAKNGGAYGPGVGKTASWFSWMPADLAELGSAKATIERLGFEVSEDEEGLTIGGYDNKRGQEAVFFAVLAPYIQPGSYEWNGEDGATWKWTFRDGKFLLAPGFRAYWDGEEVTVEEAADTPAGWWSR